MKARIAISLLQTLDAETPVYCYMYFPEDAEMITDEQEPLNKKEWEQVVEKMYKNDSIDEEGFDCFKTYVQDVLDKREINAN
jgi:hypothetical protein